METELDFHRALAGGAANSRLAIAHADLKSEIRLCLAQLGLENQRPPQELAGGHARILQAIEAGDPEAAEAELRLHLEGDQPDPAER